MQKAIRDALIGFMAAEKVIGKRTRSAPWGTRASGQLNWHQPGRHAVLRGDHIAVVSALVSRAREDPREA